MTANPVILYGPQLMQEQASPKNGQPTFLNVRIVQVAGQSPQIQIEGPPGTWQDVVTLIVESDVTRWMNHHAAAR